ncbi:MAG: barstar family protein [Lachnospiraceae bacterium]
MRVILDAERMGGRDETFLYLKEQFQFPEYFGNSLDALYDCLTELRDTTVVIENEARAGAWYQKVRRVISDACRENIYLKVEK